MYLEGMCEVCRICIEASAYITHTDYLIFYLSMLLPSSPPPLFLSFSLSLPNVMLAIGEALLLLSSAGAAPDPSPRAPRSQDPECGGKLYEPGLCADWIREWVSLSSKIGEKIDTCTYTMTKYKREKYAYRMIGLWGEHRKWIL
jgi:hypothetical protein